MGFKTLGQFIIENQADFPYAKGELSRLLRDIGIASKIINREIRKAGLLGLSYGTSGENIHGGAQKKLECYANDQFISALRSGGECCIVVSGENDSHIRLESEAAKNAKYIVALDPLDGSANVDENAALGSIFSIYRRKSPQGYANLDDALQRGADQVVAGYVIYGSSTMLVYTTGNGVNGFTLDPSIGEFCLSHPGMNIPLDGTIYSISQGTYSFFPEGLKKYISYCQESDPGTLRPYTARYVGSLVADVHRNLIKGGIFICPLTQVAAHGEHRLVYECNPMAFIIEQAGGRATNGYERILELPVNDLHQRSGLVIGSANMVLQAENFLQDSSTDLISLAGEMNHRRKLAS